MLIRPLALAALTGSLFVLACGAPYAEADDPRCDPQTETCEASETPPASSSSGSAGQAKPVPGSTSQSTNATEPTVPSSSTDAGAPNDATSDG